MNIDHLTSLVAEAIAHARDNNVAVPDDDAECAYDMNLHAVFGPTESYELPDGTLDPILVEAVRLGRLLDAMYQADDVDLLH